MGVVNREREATPETPTLERGDRHHRDRAALVPGRPHHPARHPGRGRDPPDLRRARALPGARQAGRRAASSGSAPPWIPPSTPGTSSSADVLVTEAFDPALRARSRWRPKQAEEFFDERFMRHILQQKRGVAVFVPTRARGGAAGRRPRRAVTRGSTPRSITAASRSGSSGPSSRARSQKPFLLAMTAAGQSALNVRGLDTVVIYDARYGNVVERGRNVLHRLYLGANEILQMAGRVHGRVAKGEVYILTDRRARVRGAAADAAGVPAGRRRRAGGDHLRRDRGGRRRPRPAGAARPDGVPPGDGAC